ncbi:hypothetical protein F4803DRAFT_524724 [Xylaria telfairii]|nr:hypothetical protein F4803DRAFT_524724 [Xylaria telfairii]
MSNSFEQESRTSSSEPSTGFATLEPRPRPTPDTTPESLRTAPYDCKRSAASLVGGTDIDLATTPVLSEESLIKSIADNSNYSSQHCDSGKPSEGILDISDHHSQHLIQCEPREEITGNSVQFPDFSIRNELRDEVSRRFTLGPDNEERHPSVSIITSVYHSITRILNLATRRKSRADNARVQSTIDLIKSVPTIRRTHVRNLSRQLSPTQYKQILKAIEDPDDNRLPSELKDKLRFDYTSHTRQFEIRMPDDLHSGMVGLLSDAICGWRNKLAESDDDRISMAVRSFRTRPELKIKLPSTKGPNDSKTADLAIKHTCARRCPKPTLVIEVAWSQTKEELREKADMYIRRSNGEIRTVVAIYMREMFRAEEKNEKRLERMYRDAGVDENGSYAYWEDENNQTGSASILMWRARKQKDGTVRTGNFEEKMFRDPEGNPIQSASLQLHLQDFICADIADHRGKAETFKAPLLEISSEDLCTTIEADLEDYRHERPLVVKINLDEKIQRKLEEKNRSEERLRKVTETMMQASDGISEEEGFLGRIFEGSKRVSARLKGKR